MPLVAQEVTCARLPGRRPGRTNDALRLMPLPNWAWLAGKKPPARGAAVLQRVAPAPASVASRGGRSGRSTVSQLQTDAARPPAGRSQARAGSGVPTRA